jgi:Fe-S-cluster formation regulator IscX/YfhJ
MADKPPSARRAPKRRTATPAIKPAARHRPKRAKKTLGDDFLAAVRADFRTHGAGVIAEVRADKPDQYLKIVLSVLPKDLHVSINQLDGLSDDEIRSRIRGLEAALKPFLEEFGGEDGISGAAGGTGPQAPH